MLLFWCPGNIGNEAIIVTKDDDVYAMGFNGAGCLGVGDQNSTMEPRKIEPLCQKKVKGMFLVNLTTTLFCE